MLTPLTQSMVHETRWRAFWASVAKGTTASITVGAALLTCAVSHAQDIVGRAASEPTYFMLTGPRTASPLLQAPPLAGPGPTGPARLDASTGSPRSSAPPTNRMLLLEEHFNAGSGMAPPPPTVFIGQRREMKIILPDELRPSEAMQAELNAKASSSRRVDLYGRLNDDMPELLEDDFIMAERARAAESIIGSAVEKALLVAFQGGRRHETSVSVRPEFTTVDHGFKVDASPTWSYKVRSVRSGIRLDLPLTPRPIRVQAWRDLRGTDRTPVRLGGGITLDPFDQTIRCGLSLEF